MISLNATLIIQIINFIFLMWFLNKFLFKPVLKILDERRNRVESDYQKAKELEEKIETGLDEYKKEIEQAKSEGASIRLKTREEATKVLESKLTQAKEEANKYIEEFKSQIEKDKEKIRAELEKDIEDVAKSICSTLLEREI